MSDLDKVLEFVKNRIKYNRTVYDNYMKVSALEEVEEFIEEMKKADSAKSTLSKNFK